MTNIYSLLTPGLALCSFLTQHYVAESPQSRRRNLEGGLERLKTHLKSKASLEEARCGPRAHPPKPLVPLPLL